MSLLASFYLIDRSRLEDLVSNSLVQVKKSLFTKKVIDNYPDYLKANTTELNNFQYKDFNSGVFLNVISYLEELHNINLTDPEYQPIANELTKNRGISIFLISNKNTEYLNPDNFTITEIQKYNAEFEDDDDYDTALACKEAINTLYKNVKAIKDNNQLLLFELG